MATILNEQPKDNLPEGTTWEAELRKVGFVRRILMGRRWYGVDWWFVVISSFAVIGFIFVAIFPGLLAPYSPDALVGSRFLAPGQVQIASVLIVPASSNISQLSDLAEPESVGRAKIGVIQGEPTATDLNAQAQIIDQQLQNSNSPNRFRPIIDRYTSLSDALQAVINGTDNAAVIQSTDWTSAQSQYPQLRETGSITGGKLTGPFVLGTNDIGQDLLSRLIWGTRIALIIGFSSSLVSLFLGVPLGLFAGFVGGWFDRLMSLLMDSLYAFPGLILAIAITAVLGPSILNIIVAISVLYIPTYYRIVRGQTLSVKEAIYVEAARSIGSKRSEILRRYVFPNVIPSVAIIFSVNVADAILTGAGLSFLGLGLPPTIADWGIDLARGQRFIQNAWWMITFPGLAILLVVLSFTLMGEGLTEIFNPKLRER